MCHVVARKILADETFKPDVILGLSSGGYVVAVVLSKILGVTSEDLIGMSVTEEYELDETYVRLHDCENTRYLVVDDASNRGKLTAAVVRTIEERGGTARSCVLIARADGLLPHFFAKLWPGRPPKFFWEAMARK